ncbi:SseB family protein [Dyella sp. 20L07]|uniref:SseB family protein n=1 Tax=Dyella sp. 20L07 TaxID=3384240 RepID=UPI003D268B46
MEATLYAHIPRKRVPGRLCFCQFIHPEDGRTLLPIFTDKATATWAANGKVWVLAMRARTLLELTLGAILVLNPNEERCILYPEEIVVLLDQGALPAFSAEIFSEPETVGVCPPTVPVTSLTPRR